MLKISYPKTRKGDFVDNYHRTQVADPYRWLEDTDSTETYQWIEEQNSLTFSFLENIPERVQIRERLTELWDYPKAYAPLKKGQRFFQLRNSGLQNQDVLYVMDSYEDAGRVLLDPNVLSEDGTVALTMWSVSDNGNFLAYATSESGSDWLKWRVRDISSGADLDDELNWSKFSIASWMPDNSGFFYSRYDEPEESGTYQDVNYYQKVFFHKIGEDQSYDELIYERADHKEWGFNAEVTNDGEYLVIHVWVGTDRRNMLFYKNINSDSSIVELIGELNAGYIFIGNDGPIFYLRTDLGAPRGKIIAIDIHDPEIANWRNVVPEGNDTLEFVKIINDQFIGLYLHNAYHKLIRYNIDGGLLDEIKLPTLGSIILMDTWGINGERDDEEMFFTFHSFVVPPTVYRYNFKNDSYQELFTPPINFIFSPYETQQVFVTSKDGTRVPMFLVNKRGLLEDDEIHQTLLYGYGGFNIAQTPGFGVSRLTWLERGGVLAVANIRGGSEYGEDWHQAGMLHNKQNVFDDFIASAEYLIDHGITSHSKLAIQGRSNGGLLVGACMTQRPDLFAAALPAVGVMDMLRFHKFTIGWAWVSDYGSSENPEEFKTLYAYSPLHNIQKGTMYPATLVTTADHDDRVVPGHSFKFISALQDANAGESPVLIRIQTKAGHGFGKPTTLLIEEEADIWSFLVKVLDI
jgi:prolyl oligopeptidase